VTDFAVTAISLARFGWPVFPCQPGGKAPCTLNGVKGATTDLKQVEQWWNSWPNANVGLATGGAGPGVLDFDYNKPKYLPAAEAYEILKTAGLLNGVGPIVRTRSGGWHLYFKGGEAHNSAHIQGYSVDYRGVGGYVITAPSFVSDAEDGIAGKYEVIFSRAATKPFDLEAAKAILAPPPKPVAPHGYEDVDGGSADTLARWLSRVEKGERRPSAFWCFCKAAENDYDMEPIIRAAVDDLGLEERDIRRQATNAMRLAGK
jgi:hypothetical protein